MRYRRWRELVRRPLWWTFDAPWYGMLGRLHVGVYPVLR